MEILGEQGQSVSASGGETEMVRARVETTQDHPGVRCAISVSRIFLAILSEEGNNSVV